MSLESHLLNQLIRFAQLKRWVVAYSGGLDSTVLLHALRKVNQRLSAPKVIVALHVNHQLSTNADDWQRHCLEQCSLLEIKCVAKKVTVEPSGKGLEAAARNARYQVFKTFLQPGDALLFGHHQNDQAETFLLRLLRGSGVLGLSAMPMQRQLGPAVVLRPFLNISRSELAGYAKTACLQWVEDDTNPSLVFDRNYLRHQVVTPLESRWPQAVKQISQTAHRMRDTQQLLNEFAAEDMQQLGQRRERLGVSIDWKRLKFFSEVRRNNLLRYWCMINGKTLPDSHQLQQIQQQFFCGSATRTKAKVTWSGCELRQFNHRLYLMPPLKTFISPGQPVLWNPMLDQLLKLGIAGTLSVRNLEGQNNHEPLFSLAVEKCQNRRLTVSWRQGGERCTPAGRGKSQTVKKLLQEYQLETWLRDRVPLIYIDNVLAAAGSLWVCQGFIAEPGQPAVKIDWLLE